MADQPLQSGAAALAVDDKFEAAAGRQACDVLRHLPRMPRRAPIQGQKPIPGAQTGPGRRPPGKDGGDKEAVFGVIGDDLQPKPPPNDLSPSFNFPGYIDGEARGQRKSDALKASRTAENQGVNAN